MSRQTNTQAINELKGRVDTLEQENKQLNDLKDTFDSFANLTSFNQEFRNFQNEINVFDEEYKNFKEKYISYCIGTEEKESIYSADSNSKWRLSI